VPSFWFLMRYSSSPRLALRMSAAIALSWVDIEVDDASRPGNS
jgi:hypothetical protein